MCGISGEVTFDGSPASAESIMKMNRVMQPRGPDAAGITAYQRAAFGHQRLKIIDLSHRGGQPMVDPELGLSLVFNGCIYNYRELRKELEARGYRFFSTSDTEVILKAWAEWGLEAPERMNGMFAFALYERESGRLVLGRDRLGIKPLYYTLGNGGKRLRFASTLPALLAAGDVDTDIDPLALHHYLSFHGVVPAPFTMLKGVKKLPPATITVFDPDGTRKDHTYWELSYHRSAEDEERPAGEWQDMLLAALKTAVRRRTVADVPVGVLLSGGLDSSLIVGLLAEHGATDVNTFSIGFEAAGGEAGDEFKYSDIIAREFGTTHHKIEIQSDRLIENIPATVTAMSEPMVSYDNVAFYLLSQKVSQHVKVVLSGQGADEIFAGYHWYPKMKDANDPARRYAEVFCDRDQSEMAQLVAPGYLADNYSLSYIIGHFEAVQADDPVDKALHLDSTVMLVDDPVKRVDNMTMAWALEARVPFLDHELVELTARTPARHKVAQDGKGVLKDAARAVIPDAVIDRPKGYFPVPALKYIEGPYLDMVKEVFATKAAEERGLFQKQYIDMLLAAPRDHITPLRGSKLWQVAVLEMWLQAHNL